MSSSREALAAVPDPPQPTIASQYKGSDLTGEFLLTVWTDGSHTIAWRAQSWETWSPPVELEREALS